jgi:putative endonuclease
MPYFVYILRTSGNKLYIGQTSNLGERLKEHQNKSTRSSKYLRNLGSVVLVYSEIHQSRIKAMQREWQLKKWSRVKKENLIKGL